MSSNILSSELRDQLGLPEKDEEGRQQVVDARSKEERIREKKERRKRKRRLERQRQEALDAGNADLVQDDAELAPLPVKRPDRALPSRKKNQRNAEEFFDRQRTTKRQRKAQEKTEREKAKREKRKELFAELQKYSLSAQEQQLLKSTAAMSTKETTKSKQTRALKLERAGISVHDTMTMLPTTSLDETSQIAALGGGDDEFEEELRNWKPKKKKKSWKVGAPETGGAKLVKPSIVVQDMDDESMDEEESESDNESDEKEVSAAEQSSKDNAKPSPSVDDTTGAPSSELQNSDVEGEGSDPEEERDEAGEPDPIQLKDIPTPTLSVVRVERPKEISESRQQLPVCGMEQEIMEAIRENPVVVLCGETGSGKTTQVPQFLLEGGYGHKGDGTVPKGYSTRQGAIAVTQPRRVAAVSMARRVAGELGVSLKGSEEGDPNELDGAVGYQVRYDSKTVGNATRIKFMTDGVLLREAREDLLLRRYSVIVLDEAHERNLNTDILLGILSRIVPLRAQMVAEQFATLRNDQSAVIPLEQRLEPLKVVIMSATLRVDDFVANDRLFQMSVAQEVMKGNRVTVPGVDGPYPPPVINVQARQHKVTPHFNRRTELKDYVGAVFNKVCSIHKKLPEGGILVFLTGQREIQWFCAALEEKFNRQSNSKAKSAEVVAEDDQAVDVDDNLHGDQAEAIAPTMEEAEKVDTKKEVMEALGTQLAPPAAEEDSDVDYSDIDDSDEEEGFDEEDSTSAEKKKKDKTLTEEEKEEELRESKANGGRYDSSVKFGEGCDLTPDGVAGALHVLPLYSRLPDKEQLRVFQQVPKNHRLVVVATNIAETSITIPNIKYVVDCGREKTRTFDQYSNTSRFEVQWISQASANQRLGRAGRTGPGHCYRIYSSTVMHEHFLKFSVPEVSRLPIDDVVLYMRTMAIRDVDKFPFPTAPNPDVVRAATVRLTQLGALEPEARGGGVTEFGVQIAKLPISARFAKMLVAAIASVAPDLVEAKSGESTTGSSAQEPTWNKSAVEFVRTAVALVSIHSVPSPMLHLGAMQGLEDQPTGTAGSDGESSSEDDSSSSEEEEEEEASKNPLRTRAKELHEMWRVSESDALGMLRVAGAYLHLETTVQQKKAKARRAAIDRFCKQHMLHGQSLQEMSQLRRQLALATAKMLLELRTPGRQLERQQVKDLCAKLLLLPRPPKSRQSRALRSAVVTGLLDQVARKLDPVQARAIMKKHSNSTLRRSWPYATSAATAPPVVYLHPHSYAHSADPKELPEYVVYSEVVEVLREGAGEGVVQHYARGNTAIEPEWLWALTKGTGSQCDPGKPLEVPAPRFDSGNDELRCCIQPLFGPKRWRLPTQWVGFAELLEASARAAETMQVDESQPLAVAGRSRLGDLTELRAKWFAHALLEGQVFPAVRVKEDGWLSYPPLHAVKVHARPYVVHLVSKLVRGPKSKSKGENPVYSKATLIAAWKKDPTYLKHEMAKWVKKDHRPEFLQKWDLLVKGCML